MKSAIIAVCIVACACAAVVDREAQVLRSDFQQSPEGNFQFAFETENGINGQASGQVKSVGKDEVALEVTGSNGYTAPDGQKIELTYVANENGFQPQGAHLPVAPEPEPLPEHVVRTLKYIAEHPYVEKKL